jgi:hypothetical protein
MVERAKEFMPTETDQSFSRSLRLSTPNPPRGKVPSWLKEVAAILLLCLLTLFFFWRLFTPNDDDRLAIPRGDFTDQYYPLRHFVATSLANGELPFWNPHIYGGQPGLADPQAATFYPPALLNALIWGANYPLIALELEVVAHLGWAMIGAYLFMRRGIGLSILASLFGAIVWGFGGYLTGFPLQQVTILETVAWLPWLLLAVRFTIEGSTPYRRRISAALGAIGMGCAVLAGHPQSILYLVYLAVGYAIFLLWQTAGKRWREWAGRGWGVIAILGLGIGVAAIQLLPTLAFIQESTRETLTYNFTQGGQAWAELLEIILPKVVGATPLYLGIITLLVAGLGLLAPAQRTEKVFWGGVALASLLLSLGGNSILYDTLYLGVPGFSSIRSQERVLIWWVWSVSLLAAWGIAALTTWVGTDTGRTTFRTFIQRVGWLIPVVLLPLLGLWWLRALEFSQFSVNLEVLIAFFDRYTFFFVMFLVGWAILAWRGRSPTVGSYEIAMLLVLLTFDLFSITRLPHLGASYESTVPRENEVVQALFNEPQRGRIGIVGGPIPQSNDGMVWGFDLLTGNEPLRLENSENFFNNVPAFRQFQLLNVTHVVADINLAESSPDLYEHLTASSEGAASHLHRVRTPHPYVWWVGRVEEIEGRNALYQRLQSEDFDPYRVAVIDKGITPLAEDGETAIEQARISIEAQRAGFAQFRVQHLANGPLLLLMAEPNALGREVRIDGQVVRHERMNALNIGVVVPPGEHVVTLEYHQPGWEEGIMITLLSLAGILVLAVIPQRSKALAT